MRCESQTQKISITTFVGFGMKASWLDLYVECDKKDEYLPTRTFSKVLDMGSLRSPLKNIFKLWFSSAGNSENFELFKRRKTFGVNNFPTSWEIFFELGS